MNDTRWTADLFAAIDAKNSQRFLSFLEPDAQFRFGSAPPALGIDAVGGAVDGFFASIKSLSHKLDHVWAQPDHVICTGTVTYTRHDGRVVGIPFCDVLVMRGQRIKDYLVYIDPAPLFAA